MIAACWLYSIAVVLVRLRCLIREREPLGAMRRWRNELAGFLSMGGYAFYVWGSYALTLVAMGGEVLLLLRRRRARRDDTNATAFEARQVQT